MNPKKKSIDSQEAKITGTKLGIDWNKFNVNQFRKGMNVELEHGRRNANTNISNDGLLITAKIALAHLNEIPDYYDRLKEMEKKAKEFWSKKK